jgi:hypothetical protein
MNETDSALKIRLRLLVGTQVTIKATIYTVIEVLDNPLEIVLETAQLGTQADAHGNARRQVKQTTSIIIKNSDGQIHEDFASLNLL